jgi:hypothetical protein
MKSEIHDVIHQVELAERVVLRLAELQSNWETPEDAEERRWLVTAESRLAECARKLRLELEACVVLPEFKALRVERLQRLEQDWLKAVRDLFSALVTHVGEGSPLVEVLFPHRRFEKLERGGAALRTFRSEFSTRRASTYVRRLAADPDYPFVQGLLEPVDRANEALAAPGIAEELDEDAANALRSQVLVAAEGLTRVFRQARALSEAALIDRPELFAELAFDERPKKRSPRPSTEQLAD